MRDARGRVPDFRGGAADPLDRSAAVSGRPAAECCSRFDASMLAAIDSEWIVCRERGILRGVTDATPAWDIPPAAHGAGDSR